MQHPPDTLRPSHVTSYNHSRFQADDRRSIPGFHSYGATQMLVRCRGPHPMSNIVCASCDVTTLAGPVGVEEFASGPVDALICMRPEVIALSLE